MTHQTLVPTICDIKLDSVSQQAQYIEFLDPPLPLVGVISEGNDVAGLIGRSADLKQFLSTEKRFVNDFGPIRNFTVRHISAPGCPSLVEYEWMAIHGAPQIRCRRGVLINDPKAFGKYLYAAIAAEPEFSGEYWDLDLDGSLLEVVALTDAIGLSQRRSLHLASGAVQSEAPASVGQERFVTPNGSSDHLYLVARFVGLQKTTLWGPVIDRLSIATCNKPTGLPDT